MYVHLPERGACQEPLSRYPPAPWRDLLWKVGRRTCIENLPARGKHYPGPDQAVGQNDIAVFEEEGVVFTRWGHKPNIRRKTTGGKAGKAQGASPAAPQGPDS